MVEDVLNKYLYCQLINILATSYQPINLPTNQPMNLPTYEPHLVLGPQPAAFRPWKSVVVGEDQGDGWLKAGSASGSAQWWQGTQVRLELAELQRSDDVVKI